MAPELPESPLAQALNEQWQDPALMEAAAARAASYMRSVQTRPVVPGEDDIAALSQLHEPLPTQRGDAYEILRLLDTVGSPATVANTGPRYFGFVTGAALPVTLAVKWLSDVWDQNSALSVMSPISATLEAVTEQWLIDLLGLPPQSVAGFVSGSSQANYCALAAARYQLLARQGWDVNRQGLNGAPQCRIVTSDQIHGAVVKAIAMLGFGVDCIEWVPTDDQGRIKVEAVPDLDENCLLILQAGNVNTGACDNFEALCSQARLANSWVHIDGAFGLWMAGSTTLRHHTNGAQLADSWSLDAHKTLNTPYDSGVVLCRHRDAIISALQASGDYLQFSDKRDGMLTTPEMSRRARATELWAALKFLGRSGVSDLVSGLHLRARQFADGAQARGFTVLNDVIFNQVLLAAPSDVLTRQVLVGVQRSGECWAGASRFAGRDVIRVSVCAWSTSEQDIAQSVAVFGDQLDHAVQAGRAAD